MSSGVAVDEQCLQAYSELKLHRKHRYVVFGVSSDGAKIEVKGTSKTDAGDREPFDKFVRTELPADDCRYVVYDFEYVKEGDAQASRRNKIIFVVWSPQGAKIKSKMLYASSKDALRKRLDGIAVEVQATDLDECSYDSVYDKVKLF